MLEVTNGSEALPTKFGTTRRRESELVTGHRCDTCWFQPTQHLRSEFDRQITRWRSGEQSRTSSRCKLTGRHNIVIPLRYQTFQISTIMSNSICHLVLLILSYSHIATLVSGSEECDPQCVDTYRNCNPERYGLEKDRQENDDCSDPKWQLKCPAQCGMCKPCEFALASELQQLQSEVSDVKTSFDASTTELKAEIAELKTSQDSLKSEIAEEAKTAQEAAMNALKADVSQEIKAGQDELKAEIGEIKSSQEQLKAEIAEEIKAGQGAAVEDLKAEIEALKSSLTDMQSELAECSCDDTQAPAPEVEGQ